MFIKSFIVVTYHDSRPTTVVADNPREALSAYLALGKVNPVHYGSGADLYVEVDCYEDWDFAVWHPWGGTAADHVKFALA
jgi:hypothetical protein